MKSIPLTQGLVALVDDEDYNEVGQYKWYAGWHHGSCYALRRENQSTVKMHREIMRPQADQPIDHINHNGLDNRRSNLRLSDHSLNQANRFKKAKCTSRFKGVSLWKRNGRWAVRIMHGGKTLALGHYRDERLAALAYDWAAAHLFGGYGLLNMPFGCVLGAGIEVVERPAEEKP